MNLNLKRTFNKICLKCKIDCCSKFDYAPFLSEYDKSRIKKTAKKKHLFKGNHFNTKNKFCPFYNKKKKTCIIHKNKPLDCKIYPFSFWFEMGKINLWLDPKCPMTKILADNKQLYNQVLLITKKELRNWSEGEIFGYLISDLNIEKFKEQLNKK